MPLRYRNYVFDLYGTLLDVSTDEQAPKTWKRWLRKLDEKGILHPPYYRFREDFFARDREARRIALEQGPYSVPEIDVIPIYRELFLLYGNAPLSDEALNELAYEFRKASRLYIRPFPGVEEYLTLLRKNGKKLFLLSNAQACYTVPEIIEFGIDRLTDVQYISSDRKVMKPDAAFFKMLLAEQNLNPNESVMIGDNAVADVGGAKGVGMDAIWLSGEQSAKLFYQRQVTEIKKLKA